MTKKMNAGRVILRLFLLCILIAVIILSILYAIKDESLETFKWEQLNPVKLVRGFLNDNNEDFDKVILTGNFHLYSTEVFSGNLLVLSDGDVSLVNTKGEEVWYIAHEIRKPVLRVNGQLILIYEQSGKSFMLIKNGKILLKDILEEDIAFGEITERYILFISRSLNGYKRTVNMISPDNGIKLGALYIDDYYPYYASSYDSEESGSFILYGLGMNSVRLSTIIRKYNNNLNPSPVSSIELDGLYPVLCENNELKLFVGEYGAYCYNRELDTVWSVNFESVITAAGMFENGSAVLALKGKESQVSFFDCGGKEQKNIKIENSADSIKVFKNTAAVVMGSEASFYNSAGNLIDRVKIPGLSVKVHFIDEKNVYLLSEHEAVLHRISLKRTQ